MKVDDMIGGITISFQGSDDYWNRQKIEEIDLIERDIAKMLETGREHIGEELDQYRPFIATALNNQVLAVLGDFFGDGKDEVRMFLFDLETADKVKQYWELLKEVRFSASIESLDANDKIQNPEAFFGMVHDKRVIVICGDNPEGGDQLFYAFVEAPELLCRLGKPEDPH